MSATVYGDPRIEAYLLEVRRAALGRLDLTQFAVWRRAMHDLIERRTPEQVVEHFLQARVEQGVGRPRR